MLHFEGSPHKLIDERHDADVAFWARLLDEHPQEILRAIRSAGRDVEAVRTFLATRQRGLDFDGTMAQFAESRAGTPS
jgi:hypothetical protein